MPKIVSSRSQRYDLKDWVKRSDVIIHELALTGEHYRVVDYNGDVVELLLDKWERTPEDDAAEAAAAAAKAAVSAEEDEEDESDGPRAESTTPILDKLTAGVKTMPKYKRKEK